MAELFCWAVANSLLHTCKYKLWEREGEMLNSVPVTIKLHNATRANYQNCMNTSSSCTWQLTADIHCAWPSCHQSWPHKNCTCVAMLDWLLKRRRGSVCMIVLVIVCKVRVAHTSFIMFTMSCMSSCYSSWKYWCSWAGVTGLLANTSRSGNLSMLSPLLCIFSQIIISSK